EREAEARRALVGRVRLHAGCRRDGGEQEVDQRAFRGHRALLGVRRTDDTITLADMPAPSPAPKHFSMVRGLHLADAFTLANAACGVAAVFCAMAYVAGPAPAYFFAAAALAPAAFAFDVLDGRVARRRHTHSALGRELDSLSDVISFGVAPAALGFAAGLRGGWDWVVLVYFVCCGVARL